jgi:hypothetical protein
MMRHWLSAVATLVVFCSFCTTALAHEPTAEGSAAELPNKGDITFQLQLGGAHSWNRLDVGETNASAVRYTANGWGPSVTATVGVAASERLVLGLQARWLATPKVDLLLDDSIIGSAAQWQGSIGPALSIFTGHGVYIQQSVSLARISYDVQATRAVDKSHLGGALGLAVGWDQPVSTTLVAGGALRATYSRFGRSGTTITDDTFALSFELGFGRY